VELIVCSTPDSPVTDSNRQIYRNQYTSVFSLLIFQAITKTAFNQLSDHPAAPCCHYHPWPVLPRRFMSHMPGVTTLQFGHPVAQLILAEVFDSPLQKRTACAPGQHI
jgi:hypothetical protein